MLTEVGTRERLLDAAIEVFAEFGFDGARVQEIARRAGLTTGAIYAQFRGKADLLRAAIEHSGTKSLAELLRESAVGLRPEAILTSLGSGLLDTDAPDWIEGLLLEGVATARRDAAVASILRAFLDDQTTQLGRLIEIGKSAGVFAEDLSAEAAATFCVAVFLGMVVSRAVGITLPPRGDWDALINKQVAALMATDAPQHPHTTGASR